MCVFVCGVGGGGWGESVVRSLVFQTIWKQGHDGSIALGHVQWEQYVAVLKGGGGLAGYSSLQLMYFMLSLLSHYN